jgi:hypothetical protein
VDLTSLAQDRAQWLATVTKILGAHTKRGIPHENAHTNNQERLMSITAC